MLRPTSMNGLASAITILLLATTGAAQEPIRPPDGGEEVVKFRRVAHLMGNNEIARGDWKPVTGMPFRNAFRAEIASRGEVAWDAQLHTPIKQAIKHGNVMLLSFWVRCLKSEDETGAGAAAIYVQSGGDGPRYGFRFSAGEEWYQWVRPFAAPADFDPARANITVHLSGIAQTIEVADLRLLDYGPEFDIDRLPRNKVTYEGREADAAWRKQALAGIEKVRKGNLIVEVVDAGGRPVIDAQVHARMTRHAFPFGVAVNVMVLAGDQSDFPIARYGRKPPFRSSWEDAQAYREVVEKYFTRITFEGALRPHVWKLETRDDGRHARQFQVLNGNAIPWLKQRDISIRGHYIGWGAMDSTPLQRDFVGNPEGHRKWLWEHMADVLPKTADYVYEWDTINHIVGWGKTYEAEYGGPQIHADIMREARRLAPSAVHAINEGQILPGGTRRQSYRNVIQFLDDQGQAADVVGFMGHFGTSSLTPPTKILDVFDQFAQVAPHLQVTELDVDTDGDDQLQADYLRDMLIAAFSHPNIDAIIQWGFWEKQHWKPAAALWRADWSIKPAGQAFVDLVSKQWWTDEKTKTAADGTCQVRGFLGHYDITVKHGGKSATATTSIDRKGNRIRIRL